jgi:hypothetical protein
VVVERTARNPVVPLELFRDRYRVASFAAVFLAGGVIFTLSLTRPLPLYIDDSPNLTMMEIRPRSGACASAPI